MLPKYIWIILFTSTLYVLYSNDKLTCIEKYIKLYYINVRPNTIETADVLTVVPENTRNKKSDDLYDLSTLKKYVNLEDGLYLAILGQVFDVTSGAKHYGPNKSYHAFTGLDGSAAFITGDFTDTGLSDDVSSLTDKQILSLLEWVDFYKKTYLYKGKLIGRYYDKWGNPTAENLIIEHRALLAKEKNIIEEKKKVKFPPCNVEWSPETGTRVWCSKNSGGISRDWIGVPRMLYDNIESKQHRCACIPFESLNDQESREIIQSYGGCIEDAISCNITQDL
ncbi:hypothetical protein TKK_0002527 [Trichogramma kaykai]|uniref:Cytochrome b5 heme-binding domain-containing protein n=1 Tax=Trichogramma kaykai TaxID=54128 RepID=A0ABD2WYT1_9HYME